MSINLCMSHYFSRKKKNPLFFISILYTFYQFMYQVMQEFNILI